MLLKTVFFMLCVSLALADGSDKIDPPGPVTILPPSNVTSPSPPPPPTSTTSVPPITKSSTTTTDKPTSAPTPTAKPTTASTTTKQTTTSTSTAKPTSAPTIKPTPSPSPKPDDKPILNKYNGTYTGTNTTCLLVDVAVRLEVLNTNNSMLIDIPESPKYDVTCPEPNHEYLRIFWANNNSVNFTFFKNNSIYEIESINSTLLLPETNTTTNYYHTKPEFSVSQDVSYYCGRDQPLNMTNGFNNVTIAKVHLIKLKYQAFMNTTDGKYSSVWNCDGANTSDVVPVVVGCVLAVLVVLVLVAYLFGRRRCQARGYLSMFAQDKNESDYIPMKTLSCFN